MSTDISTTHLQLALRLVSAGDEDFLHRVYASTRMSEMALVHWSAEQKEAFLRMQFQAQATHYRAYYPHAEYQIIQRDPITPIGRLIVDRSGDAILLMDIALLPEHRNAGLGTTIIQHLMAEATATDRPLILHVEVFNPAIRLYSRLGFVKIGEQGIYHEMSWKPGSGHS